MKRVLITFVSLLLFKSTESNAQRGNHPYWQQHVDYRIDIDVDISSFNYSGDQKLIYTNNSPDTLKRVYFHLFYNAFQPESEMDQRSRSIKDPDSRVMDRISKLRSSDQGYLKVINLKQDGSALKSLVAGTILEVDLNKPISPGEKVWTIKPEDVSNIGSLFRNGEFCPNRTVAVVGPTVKNPQYFTSKIGSSISSILKKIEVDKSKEFRLINGDVYSGKKTDIDGYLSYSNNLLTIIPEGKSYRMFGWLPFKDNFIPSLSKTSFSRFLNKSKLEVNTNLNGEERAMVVTGEMEKVFPMDIFPMQLVKACLNQDIERMEALGIYVVVPEDFGLIDFSSSSKIEAQEIIKKGIELIINEES